MLIDDLLLRPLTPDQAAYTLEVIEDRSGLRSTIITSQLPISRWHEAMGDPTMAAAVLDRVLQGLHRIEPVGESMRRPEAPTAVAGDEQPPAARRGEPPGHQHRLPKPVTLGRRSSQGADHWPGDYGEPLRRSESGAIPEPRRTTRLCWLVRDRPTFPASQQPLRSTLVEPDDFSRPLGRACCQTR